MKSDTEDDPNQIRILSAEVNRDLAEGQGGKHFEAELDALHSTGAQTHVPDPGVADRLNRFCHQFRHALNDQLKPQGLRCRFVIPDGRGEGFAMAFVDSHGRPFEVEYSFDEGMAAATKAGDENMGREMLDQVCRKVLNARAVYFARMQ